MRLWRRARPGSRIAVGLTVVGVVANGAVFVTALAVVGPYLPCTGTTGAGIGIGWLAVMLGLALAGVVGVGQRLGASPRELAVLAFMQLSLSAALTFTAFYVPFFASSGCRTF